MYLGNYDKRQSSGFTLYGYSSVSAISSVSSLMFQKGGRARNIFFSLAKFNATPQGYTPPYSWIIAQTAGGMASFKNLSGSITLSSADLFRGFPITVDFVGAISLTDAACASGITVIPTTITASFSASETLTDAAVIATHAMTADITVSDAVTSLTLAAAVWAALLADNAVSGSFGEFVAAISGGGSSGLTLPQFVALK